MRGEPIGGVRHLTRIFAAVSFLSLFNVPVVFAEVPLPQLIKKVQPAIVTVIGYDENGDPLQLGTGFFVDRRGHLITNRHVLAGASRAEVKGESGQTYPIDRVVAEDQDGDLIKVDVDIPFTRVRVLKLAKALPEPGQSVVVIGSPLGLEQTVSNGIVSTIREAGDFGKVIQMTAPISHGSSGSPVLNAAGQVLGIATITAADAQNLNFAIPAARAIALHPSETVEFSDWAADTHMKAGLHAAAAGEFGDSLELYQRALKLKPDWPEALDGVGTAYHALGKYDEALGAFQHAVRTNPDFAPAWYHMGEVYERQDNWPMAIDSYKKALAIEPDFANADYSLGMAYVHQNDGPAARAVYKRLQTADAELAKQLLDKIEGVK